MNVRKLLTLAVLTSLFLHVSGQDINECKVDFFLLDSQESFDIGDIGKEFIIITDNIPSYELTNPTKQTKRELDAERREKLNDNKEYNKNDPEVRDSLLEHYSNLIKNYGTTVIWWKYIGDATKDELKTLKRATKKITTGMMIDKFTYTSKDFITPDEANMYLGFLRVERSGYAITEKTVHHKTYTRYESFAKALGRYKQIKIFSEIILLSKGRKYQLYRKLIPSNVPIFSIQPKDSSRTIFYDKDVCVFNVNLEPVFSFAQLKNSKLVFANSIRSDGNYSSLWKKLHFIVDDKDKLTCINYKFRRGSYESTVDKSIDIFYDKKKLAKIDEMLNGLKSKKLVILVDGEEFVNPKITDFSFNLSSLKVSFTSNGKQYTKIFEGYKDPNYRYDSGWKDRRAKLLFYPPIYYTDCYNKTFESFNNLTLRSDNINDPILKGNLTRALKSSPEWMNYKIEKAILTNKSRWVIVTNKYTGLQESRFMFADVYVKSTKNSKCYYQKDVYFNQKADPIRGFIYSLFVSVPQTLQPYPCNLK